MTIPSKQSLGGSDAKDRVVAERDAASSPAASSGDEAAMNVSSDECSSDDDDNAFDDALDSPHESWGDEQLQPANDYASEAQTSPDTKQAASPTPARPSPYVPPPAPAPQPPRSLRARRCCQRCAHRGRLPCVAAGDRHPVTSRSPSRRFSTHPQRSCRSSSRRPSRSTRARRSARPPRPWRPGSA